MIDLKNITLNRGIKCLFESAMLTFFNQQKIGVVGNNGCGKSSLFALLLGELQQDQGDLSIVSGLKIVSVEQEIPDSQVPAIEYVIDSDKQFRDLQERLLTAQASNDGEMIAKVYALLEERDGFTVEARAAKILSGLGFSVDQMKKTVNELSGGWRERLNLARALFLPSDVLLLDEPTNHLDLETVVWLERWLARYQGLLLLISHDREFLDKTVKHILHFDRQRLRLYSGNYSAFENQYAAALELQQKQHEKQQKKIAHLQSYIDRFRVKATKAKQAQSRIKTLEKMKVIEAAHVDSPFSFEFFEPMNKTHLLTKLEGVDFGYDENLVLEKIYFRIESGMRIGLLGENGAGKTTFIKILADELSVRRGIKENAQHLKIGYFAQHSLEQLDATLSPLAHLQQLSSKSTELFLRKYLGGFDFRGEMALSPVGNFSGGEKARLALALIIFQKPNLLLLDEPTNHLDLEMRQALVLALQNFEGAMIIVSHDRFLLRNTVDEYYLVANKKVELFNAGLEGYQLYLSQQNEKDDWVKGVTTKGINPKDKRRANTEKQNNVKQIKTQIRNIEKALSNFHQQLEAFDLELSGQAIHSPQNREKLRGLLMERARIAQQVDEYEKNWIVLNEKLENE